jgi:hypothetical protein
VLFVNAGNLSQTLAVCVHNVEPRSPMYMRVYKAGRYIHAAGVYYFIRGNIRNAARAIKNFKNFFDISVCGQHRAVFYYPVF